MAIYSYSYSKKSGSWVRVNDLDNMILAFNRIANDEKNSFVVAASKESAELILERARALLTANGSVKTGDLYRSLQIKQVKVRAAKWSRTFISQPIFTVGPKYGRGAGAVNYGHAVELGHHLMRGKKHVGESGAKPFMRPAADGSKDAVVDLITAGMNKVLETFGDKP